jgi:predicted nucleic acid-binding protein
MAWCFEDERTQATDDLMGGAVPVLVPQIWPLEVGNVLMLAMRKGRITTSKQKQFLGLLKLLPITVDVFGLDETLRHVMTLAGEHHLTTYDASYLELAIRTEAAMATLDADLRRAARRMGVKLLL